MALHCHPKDTVASSDHLSKSDANLPTPLPTDADVFPKGTLSESVAAGSLTRLIQSVAALLVGSEHVREL